VLYKANPGLLAFASPALLATECVDVIGLDAFRQHAGARWPRIREAIYAHMESLLRAKLGPTDVFVRVGDDAYLVAMPSTDREDVHVACLRIAFDLSSAFLDNFDASQLHVSNAQYGGDGILVLNRVPVQQIADLVERENLLPSLRRVRAPEQELVLEHASPRLIGSTVANSAGDAAAPELTESEPAYEHEFLPVWDVANQAVTTYVCRPKQVATDDQTQFLAPKQRLQANLSCLKAGVAQIARSINLSQKFLLAISFPYPLLQASAGRMEILSACRALSSEYRDYLVFVVKEIPAGVAQTTLNNLLNTIRPFARSVSATVAPRARALEAYQGIGLRGIGLNLAEFPPSDPPRPQDVEQIAAFAHRNNLISFLSSVRNANILKLARDAGIHQLSGPAVVPAMDTPRGMWRLTWDTFAPHTNVDLPG